jgi:hypothetical protein
MDGAFVQAKPLAHVRQAQLRVLHVKAEQHIDGFFYRAGPQQSGRMGPGCGLRHNGFSW